MRSGGLILRQPYFSSFMIYRAGDRLDRVVRRRSGSAGVGSHNGETNSARKNNKRARKACRLELETSE